MNIQNILSLFKTYDINNDNELSHEELKNCKGTIWEQFFESGGVLMKNNFVLHAILQEQDSVTVDEQSTFEKMHNRLMQMGIRPTNFGTYDNPLKDYVIYENGALLYTKEVFTYNELPDAPSNGVKSAKGIDISKINLTEQELLSLVIDNYTTMSEEQKKIYEKANQNCSQLGLGIDKVIEAGYRGNSTMALLDQEYCGHKIYSDKLIYTTNLNMGILENTKSWHCAAMLSIMHKTAPDANIMHYCVTNMDRDTQDKQFADAIRDIITKNETLPDDKKVKTIIMGWGFYPDSPKYEEYIQLCKEAIEKGIFICSNNTEELYDVEFIGTDREPLKDVNNPENYTLANWIDKDNYFNQDKNKLEHKLFLPMQHLTIAHEDGISTQYEGGDGGQCWANSIGALYNTFLSINQNLKPHDFVKLLMASSDELIIDGKYYGQILNAEKAMQILQQQ